MSLSIALNVYDITLKVSTNGFCFEYERLLKRHDGTFHSSAGYSHEQQDL